MPKIGAKPEDANRPYITTCSNCGCLCEKLVSRFNAWGGVAAWEYRCQNWHHQCGTVDRDGCKSQRVYCTCGEPKNCPVHGHADVTTVTHIYDDKETGPIVHPGPRGTCLSPKCNPNAPALVQCPPLQAPDCPGHTGPERCPGIMTWDEIEEAMFEGTSEIIAGMRAAGCFEGNCGVCPACRLREAGI